jgi:type II secretory pathway pseudopilin PulG
VSRETGATLIELLVATAIMLAVSAAAVSLVTAATAQSPRWNDAADLHQRARVAIHAITRHVALASGGVPVASLQATFPAIEPRRRSSFVTSASVITTRHIVETAAWTTLTAALAPGAATAAIDLHSGCPAGVAACGFVERTDAVVLDGRGDWHLVIVEPAAPALLTVSDAVPGRTATFAAGSALVDVEETSLYFDRATGSLRQEGPGAGTFPLVDGVVALEFEYFGDRLLPLPLASLTDGPLCGSGALAYDCDLQRIRSVRATLTIAATGPDARDLRLSADITLRRRIR